MANSFAVASASESVRLSAAGEGAILFTVTNTRARPVRGRALLVPQGGAESAWFQLSGDAERDVEAGQSVDFQVAVSIPPLTSPESYALRLDVVAVHNPDEDYATGPAVAIIPRNEPAPPPEQSGYGATIIGTTIGGLAGLAAGGLIALVIGLILAAIADDIGGVLGALLITMLLFIPGPWAGAAIGSGFALRSRGFQHARLTGLLMAGIFPVWAVLTILLLALLSNAGLDGVPLYLIILLVMPPLWVIVPALSSRFLANLLRSRAA